MAHIAKLAAWGLIVVTLAAPARAAEVADFKGLWLTDLGLMELDQTGAKVKGHFTIRGVSDIKGTVTDRRLDFTFKAFGPGKGFVDLAADDKTFGGTNVTDNIPLHGRRAPEFEQHAKLVAGKMVDGSTKNLLTYTVRAPEGYKEGDAKKWPAILILHGSNMNGKAYVNTLASSWADIGKSY